MRFSQEILFCYLSDVLGSGDSEVSAAGGHDDCSVEMDTIISVPSCNDFSGGMQG